MNKALKLAENIYAMKDDAYLSGHPEFNEMVNMAIDIICTEYECTEDDIDTVYHYDKLDNQQLIPFIFSPTFLKLIKQTDMNAKLIEYAYPTSTTAKKAGYYNTGCWFVSLYETMTSIKRVKILQFFPNKKDAEQFAASLPNEYNFMHKYHN